jgi:ubiquinone/menaquinone biosynthesis C-methylase UbiE
MQQTPHFDEERAARLRREAAFHDEAYSDNRRARVDKFYAAARRSRATYAAMILGQCRGKRLLEYGCGQGSLAFAAAKAGAEVVGIDISPVAIHQAEDEARRQGIERRSEFLVMNAEELEFPDRSFDIVCGTGILHHLDLAKSYAEIERVLKPGGEAIFFEPMGHNPLINWFRNRTPELRTPDEHPLLMSDIEHAKRHFRDVSANFFHLSSIGIVPLRNTAIFKPLYAVTEAVDQTLMTIVPPLKKWAWMTVIRMQK